MDILVLLSSIWNPDATEIRDLQMKIVIGAIIIVEVLFYSR